MTEKTVNSPVERKLVTLVWWSVEGRDWSSASAVMCIGPLLLTEAQGKSNVPAEGTDNLSLGWEATCGDVDIVMFPVKIRWG